MKGMIITVGTGILILIFFLSLVIGWFIDDIPGVLRSVGEYAILVLLGSVAAWAVERHRRKAENLFPEVVLPIALLLNVVYMILYFLGRTVFDLAVPRLPLYLGPAIFLILIAAYFGLMRTDRAETLSILESESNVDSEGEQDR